MIRKTTLERRYKVEGAINPKTNGRDEKFDENAGAKRKKSSWVDIIGRSTVGKETLSEDDRRDVLEKGLFFIASQLFVVRPWKVFIESECEEMKTLLIWVLLKKFLMGMLDSKGFNQVASGTKKGWAM
ncbi:hypothetical protein FRX31_017795 [Thalictrum thalictroides]|uniref:Uncharacterized protein n=1 Tax=Thalictrum thalictroides TaxID=46969 RepID=A0A7J6W750_THATH|nr:hypothetical protein FRX31_017795 [Thalictrum thalictroides]